MRARLADGGEGHSAPPTWTLGGPWQRRELMFAVPGVAVGPVGLLVSWLGARSTRNWAEQDGWIAVGTLCLAISLAAAASWVRVGLRNMRTLQRTLVRGARTHLSALSVAVAPEQADGRLVTAAGLTLFHRPDCLLVNGKSVHSIAPGTEGSGDRTACRMCLS
jgi:hypothetical protein